MFKEMSVTKANETNQNNQDEARRKKKREAGITIFMIFLVSAAAAIYTVSYRLKLERLIREGKIVPPKESVEEGEAQEKPGSFRLDVNREGFITAKTDVPVLLTISPAGSPLACTEGFRVSLRTQGALLLNGAKEYSGNCSPVDMNVSVSLPEAKSGYLVADVAYLSGAREVTGSRSVMFTTVNPESSAQEKSTYISATIGGVTRQIRPMNDQGQSLK